jgi:hypothetical protein
LEATRDKQTIPHYHTLAEASGAIQGGMASMVQILRQLHKFKGLFNNDSRRLDEKKYN